MLGALVWGNPAWLVPAVLVVAVAAGLVIWSYWRGATSPGIRLLAALLKIAAVIALALCLIEPLFSGIRPRPGANLFVLLADNSQSLTVRDARGLETRGEKLRAHLRPKSDWQTRLDQDFEVRRYLFDTRIKPVSDFSEIDFKGSQSTLNGALESVRRRLRGRPTAGVLLLTDGNATDWNAEEFEAEGLPPVYPVIFGEDQAARDVSIRRVAVSQSNFEAAPVTVLVEADCHELAGEGLILQLLDEAGELIQEQKFRDLQPGKPLLHRFEMRPDEPGVSFYRVRALVQGEEKSLERPAASREATLVNNTRWFVVDRGRGPYRVLYVAGRPNWDFKFLRRALAEDEEVQLVGLMRIARREPKFTFRGHLEESTNPLYRGFGNQEEEEAEQYDQPVLLRLGTADEDELRDGFPKAADSLYGYHAVILDDVEAGYFTQDQMSLLQEFVSERGGGFLMLGGRESFAGGKHDRTPIGEMLPVYPGRAEEDFVEDAYRMLLTRDGWLQPWVRLRDNESDEETRISQMPAFRVLNHVQGLKPGAVVLSRVVGREGDSYPALVVQKFGRGRTGALLVGDMWRWNLRREEVKESDLEKAWRQTLRWLVADVPGRVEAETRRRTDQPGSPVELEITVRDPAFVALDNATVEVRVETPDDEEIRLTAESSDSKPGVYVTAFVSRQPGPYRATVTAEAPDGSEIGTCQTGWSSNPAVDEFQTLVPNRSALEQLAADTGGEIVQSDGLADFAASLPNRKIPVTEPWIYPLWHQWSVFLVALSCLVGEWGLRRWKGLP